MGCVPPNLRIVRKSSFTPQPWKNGGGVTYEGMRMPAEGEPFAWRMSVARVESSGSFSDFAGYNRKIVLLEGDGFELDFIDGGKRRLARVGELAEFDGALAPGCTLLGGPCLDLNLMVAKAYSARVGVARLAGKEVFHAAAKFGESTLIFSIEGALELSVDSEASSLHPGDLAFISSGGVQVSRLQSHSDSDPSAVFFAMISH